MVKAMSITSRYQVTVPKEVRDVLGIQSHDALVFNVKNGQVTVERALSLSDIQAKARALIKKTWSGESHRRRYQKRPRYFLQKRPEVVAVDTNFIIRLLVGEPKDQAAEAKGIYSTAEPRTLLVDRIILAESLYVLRSVYKFSRLEALEILTDLLKGKPFGFIDSDICESILNIMAESNLSPEDACLAALVRLGRVESVGGFDERLHRYLATYLG